jgi:hypothetical protein
MNNKVYNNEWKYQPLFIANINLVHSLVLDMIYVFISRLNVFELEILHMVWHHVYLFNIVGGLAFVQFEILHHPFNITNKEQYDYVEW